MCPSIDLPAGWTRWKAGPQTVKPAPLFKRILVYSACHTTLVLVLDRSFVIEHDVLVRQGIEAYRSGKGNFADYLIGGLAHHAGCLDTVTFDHALAGHARFTVLR